ncbi:hypothetical protein B0H34DRAFT_674205 [Crassisporium funariophilum]|nr:hypothetical protein B0H34DRAFT_674205 [Crassisporium funariophilum]
MGEEAKTSWVREIWEPTYLLPPLPHIKATAASKLLLILLRCHQISLLLVLLAISGERNGRSEARGGQSQGRQVQENSELGEARGTIPSLYTSSSSRTAAAALPPFNSSSTDAAALVVADNAPCSSSSSIGNAAALVVALTAPCLSDSATGAADAVAPSRCLQATAAAVMLLPHIIAIWVEGRGVGRVVDGSLRRKRQGGRAGKGSLGLPSLLFTPNQPKPVKTLAHIPQRLKRGS